MNIGQKKYCVFCGNLPEDKNKEHILPQWLLKLTGNPKRIVPIVRNFKTNKIIKFDWSSFTFPSCKSCNDHFSKLENEVKPIVIRLLNRESITTTSLILLLDWLDKVRTGLWLGYGYLQNNIFGIKHKFFINQRIAMMDRMLAVYPIDSQEKGLNSFGVETFGFQLKPSCISLRINNIHILNMSWEFMCSARCGFPFPKYKSYDEDCNVSFSLDNIEIYSKVKNPIMRMKFIKPSIHIYQPILSPILAENYWDHNFLEDKKLSDYYPKGALFRQCDNMVEIIKNMNTEIDFDEITDDEAEYTKNIVKQTYEIQSKSLFNDDYFSTLKSRKIINNSFIKTIKDDYRRYTNHLKNI